MGVAIRTIAPDEVTAAARAVTLAFGAELEDGAEWPALLEPDRTLVADDDGEIVGTAGAFSFTLSVPGGELPAAAITAVSVRATHRRQGVLRAFMSRLLADARRRGEPLAALWSSEASIYGRFGFGVASRGLTVCVPRAQAALRPRGGAAARARVVPPAAAPAALAPAYDALRRVRPGVPNRTSEWWRLHRLRDEPASRSGAGPLTCALIDVPGEAPAYALYRMRPRWQHGVPDGTLDVAEAIATGPASWHALWEYLLGVDLVGKVEATAPVDGPLQHLLVDPRRAVATVEDGVWVRLMDVPAALRGRTYASDGALVVEVTDELVPENAGRWRLEVGGGEARVAPTTAACDLALGIGALSSAYLGGVGVVELADAGLVVERSPGAAARADALLRAERAPWCPEIF